MMVFIEILAYVASVLFCWHQAIRFYRHHEGLPVSSVELVVVFVPFFNIAAGIAYMSFVPTNAKLTEKFFRINKGRKS